MKQTIYADVLVIINIYINYGLLLLTCFWRKREAERLKILLSSLLGGIYSLIILLPGIGDYFITISRIPALMIMIYIAFGYCDIKSFAKISLTFFGVNIIFAGAVFMLWFFLYPQSMYFNSGIVYFDINALTLVLLTIAAYGLIRLLSFFTKSKVPQSFIYNVEIILSGKSFVCKGFYDSGNTLCDPFSGEAVTVVYIGVLKSIVNESVFNDIETQNKELSIRLIPVNTLSGQRLLPCLRAEKIRISGLENSFELKNPVIALCKDKIHGGEYGALLNTLVFDNAIKGNGEKNVLYT